MKTESAGLAETPKPSAFAIIQNVVNCSPKQKKNMKKIKVALAGFGSGGRIYNAPILAAVEDFVIVKILTGSPVNISAAKQDFPEAAIVGDYSEVLGDPEIDLVIITTPNHLHKEYTEKALKAGKHVVVEKPLTPTFEEAEYLAGLAREQNRILSVNHNRRWDSDIRTLKKILDRKLLGEVVEFESHFDRFRPEIKNSWKERSQHPGSGILYDLGSHLIDQALWLFGPPKEVFAHLRIQREAAEVVDNFELLLLYPRLKVTLKAGMLVKEPGPKYQVFGTEGSYVKSGMDVQEEALKNGEKPLANWGLEPEETWGRLNGSEGSIQVESERGDYREFYRNIAAAVRGEAALDVTPQQAAMVVKIIELAYLSNAEKRILPFEY